MNIEILQYFKEIADLKSISKASVKFHISQSALSQMIQKLEDNIDYKLFNRSNKGVELTKMGKIVYEYTKTILKTYEKMLNELDSVEKNQVKLIIDSTWAISYYSLPALLIEAKKKYPYIDYEIHSDRSEEIVENVENGIADIGIIYGDYNSDKLSSIYYGNEDIVLVANSDYNISDKISLNELFNYQMIYFKNGCYYTDIKIKISKFLDDEVFENEPLLNLDSISAVKSSILEGYGIAFLPYSSVRKEVNEKQFKIIEVDKLFIKQKINIISLKTNNNHIRNIIDL